MLPDFEQSTTFEPTDYMITAVDMNVYWPRYTNGGEILSAEQQAAPLVGMMLTATHPGSDAAESFRFFIPVLAGLALSEGIDGLVQQALDHQEMRDRARAALADVPLDDMWRLINGTD